MKSIKTKIPHLLTIWLVIAGSVLGNVYSCLYAYAGNTVENENIKFNLRPYINKPTVSNEDNQALENTDETNELDDPAIDPAVEPAPTDNIPANGAIQSPPTSLAQPSGCGGTEKTAAAGPSGRCDVTSDQDHGASACTTKTLQGQVVYRVPCGTPIKLKMASVPSHPMKLMNRDFDGNLYPARLGQVITARTSEDIYIEKNKIIPEGTIFSGTVSKILPPRRVGRPGSLVLSFDELTTPDGRKFAFRVEADNRKPSTVKTKAKGFGIIAYHAFGGAVVGALVAYEIFGLQNTIALHGYNIAAGAAGGALIATGFAIMRKGPKATLEPGDDLNMTIDEDLIMPAAITVPEKKVIAENPGLTMAIEKSKIVKDGLGEHFVTVDMTATNDGDKDLSSIDLFLEDTNKDRHPLCSSPDEDSQFLFHLEPHSTQHLHLSFLTPFPKLKQQLVWLDHETKIVLAKQNL